MSENKSLFEAIKKWLNQKIQKRVSIKFIGILVLIVLMPYILQLFNSSMKPLPHSDFNRLLFTIESHVQSSLEKNDISIELVNEFGKHDQKLSEKSIISSINKEKEWIIEDEINKNIYHVRRENSVLNVYSKSGLGIDELISTVRRELQELESRRIDNKESALFEVKDFDLEISFVVQSRSTLRGNIEYYFITVDNEIETAQERIQRIKLHLTAIPQKHGSEKASEEPIGKGKNKLIKVLPPK